MEVVEKLESYPSHIKVKLGYLRQLILDVAKKDGIDDLQETLKWGELSYIAKEGSTIRIDWKPKTPNEYAMYFNCKTKLVETFKEIHGEVFRYGGNRAIIFCVNDKVPENELRHCISLSLRYHKVKNIPLLGA